jgi:hypothetical protein
MAYCGNCDGCELYGCSYYCEAERNKAPTQLEKLQAILNRGIEYIYNNALLNFSIKRNMKPEVESDEFNIEITDPYEARICILCSGEIDVCNCYNQVEKMYKNDCEESYGYFVDIKDCDARVNYSRCTDAVNMKVVVRNIDC